MGKPPPVGSKSQIKITVGFDKFPKAVKIFNDKAHAGSEEVALKKAILNYKAKEEEIIVFDRGLSSRKTFQMLDEETVKFVTRLNDNTIYKEIGNTNIPTEMQVGNLTIEKDVFVNLGVKGARWLNHPFRLIVARVKAKVPPLFF